MESSGQQPAADGVQDRADSPPPSRVCRICLHGDGDTGGPARKPLCSPCKCIGTHQWVHPECLEQWTSSVRATDPRKSEVCDVCGSFYKKPFRRGVRVMRRTFREVAAQWVPKVGCLLCLWVMLPPYPVVRMLLCMATFLMVFLALNGLSVILTAHGFPALMRQGAPVPGLYRGMVLVSTETMPAASPFHQAVILLIAHSPTLGSLGMIINRKGKRGTPGYGGPVEHLSNFSVFSRNASPVFERVIDGVWWASGRRRAVEAEDDMWVVQGYAGWAPRQLDGEVRHGSWTFGHIDGAELMAGDTGHDRDMWARLKLKCEEQRGAED